MSGDLIIAAIVALGGTGTVGALYRWARSQGRADALAEQARKTIEAKDAELAELEAENARLWAVLDSLTSPPEER